MAQLRRAGAPVASVKMRWPSSVKCQPLCAPLGADLHSRGIVHGDLSSNNVLLNSSMKDARRFTAQVGACQSQTARSQH